MLKKHRILFILLLTLSSTTFTGLGDSGYDQVHLGPGNKISDINFVIRHANQSARNDYALLVADMSEKYGNDFEIVAPFTSGDVKDRNVLVLFNSEANSTTDEIQVIKTSLEAGNGLLLVSQPGNTSVSSQELINGLFETEVMHITKNQINGSLFDIPTPYVLADNFNSPKTPVTQNISKLVIPKTSAFTINSTAVSETNLTIKDIYPLFFDSKGNALAIAIELKSYGRIVVLGSRLMLSDDVTRHLNDYSSFVTTDNNHFAFNVITWLGRGSGYINKYSHTLNVSPLQQIKRGTVINSTVDLRDQDNNTLTDVQITLEIEFSNHIVESAYMSLDKQDNLFHGQVSTINTLDGTANEIQVSVSKRGFLDQTFNIGRVTIILEFNSSTLPNLVMISLLGAGILIFFFSFYLLWTNFKKIDNSSQ